MMDKEQLLRRIKLKLCHTYSGETLATLRIANYSDSLADRVTKAFIMTVYAQDLQEQTEVIRTPLTWWDHLKADHAPEWFDKRFPPKYETITVTFKPLAMYPLANIAQPELGKASFKFETNVSTNEEEG